jgi:hypothetical protein
MGTARQSRLHLHGRWLPAALAVALIAAQGTIVAHFALARHVLCPENGELIHPEGAPLGSADAHPAKLPALNATQASDQGHGHEHCVVVGQRREALTPARTEIVGVDSGQARILPSTNRAAPASEPRFRLAPKQSPPA